MIKLDDIVELQGNLKELSKSNYARLKHSILKHGMSFPLNIAMIKGKPYGVIDGHQRPRVIKRMVQEDGFSLPSGKLPVTYTMCKTKKQAKELILQAVAQYGKVTEDGLSEFITEAGLALKDLEEYDLPNFDMDAFLESQGSEQSSGSSEEPIPEPPKKPITKLGDLWILGKHRVLCGDAMKKEDVKKLMGRTKADCMITDPPYGVGYEGGAGNKKKRSKIENDDRNIYAEFLALWDYAPAYIWFADRRGDVIYNAVLNAGYTIRSLLIWNKLKPHYGAYMAQYLQKHEPCLYCVKKDTPWYGPTNEVTVWDIEQPTANVYHPTQKPHECMARPIRNSTKRGDLVADPFLGSGTTLIAAEQLGRICYGMEIDPGYCDVIVERWETLTEKKAKRKKK